VNHAAKGKSMGPDPSWVVEQSNCLIKMHRTVIGKCGSGDIPLYYEKNIDQSEVKEVKVKSHDGITMISFYFKEDIAGVLVRASEAQSARGEYSYLLSAAVLDPSEKQYGSRNTKRGKCSIIRIREYLPVK
jgi:hypothetical protein